MQRVLDLMVITQRTHLSMMATLFLEAQRDKAFSLRNMLNLFLHHSNTIRMLLQSSMQQLNFHLDRLNNAHRLLKLLWMYLAQELTSSQLKLEMIQSVSHSHRNFKALSRIQLWNRTQDRVLMTVTTQRQSILIPIGASAHQQEMMKRKLWGELVTSLHQTPTPQITRSQSQRTLIGDSAPPRDQAWQSVNLMLLVCKPTIFLLVPSRAPSGTWDWSSIPNLF